MDISRCTIRSVLEVPDVASLRVVSKLRQPPIESENFIIQCSMDILEPTNIFRHRKSARHVCCVDGLKIIKGSVLLLD